MTDVFEGQCQCGDVRYRVSGTAATLFACHCTECQRQSASAFGMALWIKAADIELLSGEPKEWIRITPGGKRMACRFCPTCGTRLFHQMLGQAGIVSIKPGTLDNTKGLAPVAHIWTASRQSWIEIPEATLQYPQGPPDFEDMFAAWAQVQARTDEQA